LQSLAMELGNRPISNRNPDFKLDSNFIMEISETTSKKANLLSYLNRYRIFICIAVATLVILGFGLSSQVFMGDEVHHYRFAKNTFVAGHRAIYDEAYRSPNPPGFIYATDAAWPLGLAFIWKMIGRISFPVAQTYHAFFYALLLLSTYGISSHLYGKKTAEFSVCLLASVPMIIVFSILFYVDVPASALMCATLFFLIKRKYLIGGVLLGLAFLMKRNIAFFLPTYIGLYIYQNKRSFKDFIFNAILFFAPPTIMVFADIYWRHKYLYSAVSKFDLGEMAAQRIGPLFKNLLGVFHPTEFTNSLLTNPIDDVKYFGPPLLALLALYFVRKLGERKDWMLWGFVIPFLIFFFLLFGVATDIRYILPVTPFLAILGAKTLARVSKKFVVFLFMAIMVFQAMASAFYLSSQRKPSLSLKEGFDFIRQNIPEHTIVFYPETNFTEMTNRPMIWSVMGANRIFWSDDREATIILKALKIEYVLVKKNRIYDDYQTDFHHAGAYPQSFVDRLPKLEYIEGPLFENKELSLWKVKLQMPERAVTGKNG
jgi:hypothetical protein